MSQTNPETVTVTVTLKVDGVPLQVPNGQSVAAALMLIAEQPSWRSTRRKHLPRGLFCGIGSCFDCLVTVNDQPNQRACLVPASDGMHITTGKENDAG